MSKPNILEKMRKQYGHNRKKFCKFLGIKGQNYCRYLKGTAGLGYDKAVEISKKLGISIKSIEDNNLVGRYYYREKKFVKKAKIYNQTHPFRRKLIEKLIWRIGDYIEEGKEEEG